MKKIWSFFLIGFLFVVITGCPYESKVALSDFRRSFVDTAFLGKWQAVAQKNISETIEIEIFKFNSTEYLINYQEIRPNSKSEKTLLRAFATKINNHVILNINELGVEHAYSFYKFELKDDRLIVSYVSDNFIKNQFDNEAEIYDFFEKNINAKDFFEEQIVFKKNI